ncbi:hypothetical protein F4677DRAFT_32095 [Hypoxylon crocopeplum]|nr:hypothetical protein F4677DRAFT_32095 [Hypoxylon crocopeplum]
MANLGPLTTTFVPSGTGCQSIHLGTNAGVYWLQYGTGDECVPSDYSALEGYYYSPGICPQGYTYACRAGVGPTSSSITAATCCPSEYACQTRVQTDPNACKSIMASDSSYVVDVFSEIDTWSSNLGTTTTFYQSGAPVYARGFVVLRDANDVEWFTSTAMSTITTTSTPIAATSASTPGASVNTAGAVTPAASNMDSSGSSMVSAQTDSPSSTTVYTTSSLSTGAKLGLGLGVPFGILVVVGAVAVAYLLGRRKGHSAHESPGPSAIISQGEAIPRKPKYELHGQSKILEMSSLREPVELMGSPLKN